MSSNRIWPHGVRTAVLIGMISCLAGPAALVDPARAGCTNYADYLHWISELVVIGHLEEIFVQEDYAYITECDLGLRVVDYTNDTQPVLLGGVEIPHATGVAVSGDLAVVTGFAQESCGMYLVDVSVPTAPAVIDSLLPGISCANVVISGSMAYLTTGSQGYILRIVDISNPESPIVHPVLNLPAQPRSGLVVAGNYAYITCSDRLVTVDISDPDAAFIADQDIFAGGVLAQDLVISGDYLLVSYRPSSGFCYLMICGLEFPDNPNPIHSIPTPIPIEDNYPLVEAAAGIIFYGGNNTSIYMYGVADAPSITILGPLPDAGGTLADLAVYGHTLYNVRTTPGMSGYGSIHAISASSPDPLVPIASVWTPGTAEDVVIATGRADYAYVADGDAGLQVVNVTDPLNPVIVGFVDTPGYAANVALLGSTVFVADGAAGVHAIDVSNPNAPSILDTVDTPGSAVDIAVTSTHAFVADSDRGVRVIDISTPTDIFEVGAQDTLTLANGIDVAGGYAYVADKIAGLVILSVSDPENPWIIDGVKGRDIDIALKVDYRDGRVYVTDETLGLVIVDVSDPASPVVQSSTGTEDTAGDVSVMGIFAYVGSGAHMQLVDIQNDADPITAGSVRLPADARGLYIDPYYAYITTGDSLHICPCQCGFDQSAFADFLPTPQEGYCPLSVTVDNLSEGYGLVYDWDFGDGTGGSAEFEPTHVFVDPGDYTVTLIATNGVNADTASAGITVQSEAPFIKSVVDVPQDQGGFVYVNYYHSVYDDTEPNRSELYTVQRQDAGVWVNLTSFGAYGAHYYTALAVTPGDGESWTTPFRVIAHMDEGIWIGAPVSGYSEDNIAPEAPANVAWATETRLEWDAVAAVDFAYYRVYGSTQPTLDGAVSLATTIDTEVDLVDVVHNWVLVVAVDDAGLESEPSTPLVVTGVPEVITSVQLSRAVPNPFNPSTTLEYALPAAGPARLCVYDVSGRLVRVLVDGEVPAGRHAAVWHGRDETGRKVASGTYFSRLEAGSEVRIGRMLLLK